MHFEILVEDQSGKTALDFLIPKILQPLDGTHSFRTIPYKGIGRIPKDLKGKPDPAKRALLTQLPRLLRGYGKSLDPKTAAVVVVVDLDDKDCLELKRELLAVLEQCEPRPTALFRIAIEEGEAWLLGDSSAVKSAYPNLKSRVLDNYQPDSICGTWEVLADAVHPGGSAELKKLGFHHAGMAKSEWASRIAPRIEVDSNRSPSFQVFREGLRRLARDSESLIAG